MASYQHLFLFPVSKPCPLVLCPECPDGFRREKLYNKEDGCSVVNCKCVPNKLQRPCPSVFCPMGKFGECKLVTGCRICKCLPICPRIPKFCPPGCYRRTKNGCPYCQCVVRPPICSPIRCLLFCPHGYEKDVRGCYSCRCKPRCRNFVCNLKCKNGYGIDEKGCSVCKCKPATVECPPTACTKICRNGFQVDKFGCRLCKCKMRKCSGIVCRKYCPFGFEKDDMGCKICRCRRIPIEFRPVGAGAPGTFKG